MNDITDQNDNTTTNGTAMNGNDSGRRRRRTKRAVWLTAAGLCTATALVAPIGGTSHADPAEESLGMLCTDGVEAIPGHRAFNITATDGYTSEPDGNSIYGWGYTSTASFQLPGPVLCVNQGEVVDVTLTNLLPVNTSIQFPGQLGVVTVDGPVGPVADADGNLLSLVPEASAGGGQVTYTFTAVNAGTYVYQSGSDPQLQVQMGLFGAIVVRPVGITISADDIMNIPVDGGTTNGDAGMTVDQAIAAVSKASCAYASVSDATKCDPLAIYNSSRENILMLSEIDPGLHSYIEQHLGSPADLTWNAFPGAYEAHYFLINGRSMPDTLAPNLAPWLPSQPYGALAAVQPWDVGENPLDALLRYVGVGITGYDFHPHSNHEHVIAQDGSLMKGLSGNDNTEEKFNILVNPSTTVDATFRWTNEEGYKDQDGHRLPVTWPQGLNMMEGDFWSGSPYLGSTGALNPGILTKTQCGEYYHVAHSHDLTQATNYGITFGGMLTLIKVEPPESVQGLQQGDFIVPVCK